MGGRQWSSWWSLALGIAGAGAMRQSDGAIEEGPAALAPALGRLEGCVWTEKRVLLKIQAPNGP